MHYSEQERSKLIDAMVEEKFRTRKAWNEIADEHKIARKTIYRWRQTEEWQLMEAKWRRILREEARTEVHEIANSMIGVLQDLAYGISGNGEKIGSFTRFSAAKTLLEFVGIDAEFEERKLEQNDQFLDFLKQLKKGPISPQVLAAEVRPGGYLPESIIEANQDMMEERLREDVVEAEFMYTGEDPEEDPPLSTE